MSKNQAYLTADRLRINVAAAAGSGALGLVKSGDPVAVGQITGVAETDELTAITGDQAAGTATINRAAPFSLSVKGIDAGGNSAVANGDILYYVDGDTPRLSKKVAGVKFGVAYDPDLAIGVSLIAAGATGTIVVVQGKF